MLANQPLVISRLRHAAGLVIVLGTLGGCASWHSAERMEPSRSSGSSSNDGGPVERSPTATEVAAEKAGVSPTAPVLTSEAINPTAPATYTVKRGDTLWDISAMYLKDPWLWPEIWHVNPQLVNPHLIYPGDVLALVYGADGRPSVYVQTAGGARLDPMLRSLPLNGAIATIPYSSIAAFLERPSVISKEQLRSAPRIVALRDHHVIAGAGHVVYVQGIDRAAQRNGRYAVVHVGDPIKDPDGRGMLGYQGIYAATGLLTEPGAPATVTLTDSAREALVGDRLLQVDNDVPLNFLPRSPRNDVTGRIISVMEGVSLIGQYRIVAINRGKSDGLESGHVLAIDQAGEMIRDQTGSPVFGLKIGSAFGPRIKLPDERAGTLLVFKVYDRMSYGLVVEARRPIRLADVVRTP